MQDLQALNGISPWYDPLAAFYLATNPEALAFRRADAVREALMWRGMVESRMEELLVQLRSSPDHTRHKAVTQLVSVACLQQQAQCRKLLCRLPNGVLLMLHQGRFAAL